MKQTQERGVKWEDITGTVLQVQEPGFCEACDRHLWAKIQAIGIYEYLVCEKCFIKFGGK